MTTKPLDSRRLARGLAVLVVVYALVVYAIPRPATVTPEGWRLTGIFAATIVGSILQPMPGGALVLTAITLASLVGGLPIGSALAGYADANVWLVMAAFFIARALIDTGLARRIALWFVRRFGRTSLGIAYALGATDLVLAMAIPSNGARSGGVTLPIARSIAELYGSQPGTTPLLLGSFLISAVYQSICVTTAMFLTGQTSNAQVAAIASQQFHYPVTWSSWLIAGIVPGLVSLAVVPWVVMRLNPPKIVSTPEATEFAAKELAQMGRMNRDQRILTAVFAGVCGLWISSGHTHIDVTATALAGSAILLLTGVLDWNQVIGQSAAWDMFIWYGGVIRLGRALNDAGVTHEFANGVVAMLGGYPWPLLLGGALLIYFYAHYAFASITAHILAMYAPFVAVLAAQGAPLGLVIFALACLVNLSAGLTHYGTTPAPMFFAQGYVPMRQWWSIGAVVSVVNLLIWGTVGFGWWRLLGYW